MSAPSMTDADLIARIRAIIQCGSVKQAVAVTGLPRSTLKSNVQAARERFPDWLPPSSASADWAKGAPINPPTADDVHAIDAPALEKPRLRVHAGSDAPPKDLPDRIAAWLMKRSATSAELAAHWKTNAETINAAIDALASAGMRVAGHAGGWRIIKAAPEPAWLAGPLHTFVTNADNTFTFGASGDQHLCSKYERLDVLNSLYDTFEAEGCRTVFNTGNWVDGEARFNLHDLHTHGMDAQMRYLAHAFPRRDGITTYAVAGDDHEGWYAQREGVDIGKYAERTMRDAGRTDWVDLGYMEAPVRLVNANTGKEAIISIVHPGGGSSYALSYAIQKIIESLDGGEKPAVHISGHYHKLWSGNIRNVWCAQTGTTQDQTTFMRKKKLEAHVGGLVIKLTQDPATGAITRFRPEILRFFNRGYYANRWSSSGPINKAERQWAGLAA